MGAPFRESSRPCRALNSCAFGPVKPMASSTNPRASRRKPAGSRPCCPHTGRGETKPRRNLLILATARNFGALGIFQDRPHGRRHVVMPLAEHLGDGARSRDHAAILQQHDLVRIGRGQLGADPARSSPSATVFRSAAMAGRMPAAASCRSRWQGPNSEPTAPAGRPSPNATPRSPRASLAPSGSRSRAARRHAPASSPARIAPSGSSNGGVRHVCTASAYHQPRPRRRLRHPTSAPHEPRSPPICAPTPTRAPGSIPGTPPPVQPATIRPPWKLEPAAVVVTDIDTSRSSDPPA